MEEYFRKKKKGPKMITPDAHLMEESYQLRLIPAAMQMDFAYMLVKFSNGVNASVACNWTGFNTSLQKDNILGGVCTALPTSH